MQVSSVSLPPWSSHQRLHHPSPRVAESSAIPTDTHRPPPAGSPAPVERTAHSAKSADTATEQKSATRSEQTDSKAAKEKDPLTDPTSAEYAQIKELVARDKEVRAHEQAHLSAAGQYATGGMQFSYQAGPDGKRYAIGGEVGIDVSAIPDDPAATIAKMQVVQRAATAPAEPSGQDMRVAAQAAQTASAARAELSAQQMQESRGETEGSEKPEASELKQSTTEKEASRSYRNSIEDLSQSTFEARV